MIPKSSTCFSLVELLVVVALIGIMSSIGIVTYTGYIEGANKNSAENIVQQIALAQTEAYANSGSYYVTGCPATSTTSAAIESELFSGDNIIPDDNEFEVNILSQRISDVKQYKKSVKDVYCGKILFGTNRKDN